MGKNIIITGSSRGIGRAIAKKITTKGDRVVVNYLRNESAAKETAEFLLANGVDALVVQGNVRSEDDLKRLAGVFETVDVLVHNAAIGALKDSFKMRRNQWDLTLESSLRPFWLLTKHCNLSEGGLVVGISSLGSRRFIPGYAAMGASKAGMEALTRQLAVELASRKVRVNTICGGLIQTDTIQYFPQAKEMLEHAEKMTPLGRIGLPEDVANAVWLLCQPESHWITGQVIVVDGGLSLR